MKLRFLLLLFCFTVVSSPVKSKDTTGALADSSSLFNPAYADRIILLGFSDRHIKRIQRTAHVSSYRRRGPYQSSTWSRHITSKLEQIGFKSVYIDPEGYKSGKINVIAD